MKVIEQICISSEEAHIMQDFIDLLYAIQDLSNNDDVLDLCKELILEVEKLDDFLDLE